MGLIKKQDRLLGMCSSDIFLEDGGLQIIVGKLVHQVICSSFVIEPIYIILHQMIYPTKPLAALRWAFTRSLAERAVQISRRRLVDFS